MSSSGLCFGRGLVAIGSNFSGSLDDDLTIDGGPVAVVESNGTRSLSILA